MFLWCSCLSSLYCRFRGARMCPISRVMYFIHGSWVLFAKLVVVCQSKFGGI